MQLGSFIDHIGTFTATVLAIAGFIFSIRSQNGVNQLEQEKHQTQKTLAEYQKTIAEQQVQTNEHISTLVETLVNQIVDRSISEGANTDDRTSNQLATLARGVRDLRHDLRLATKEIGALGERIQSTQTSTSDVQTAIIPLKDRLNDIQLRLNRIDALKPEELVHMLATTHEINRLAAETKDHHESSEQILTEIRNVQLRITEELGRYGYDIDQLRSQLATIDTEELTRRIIHTLGERLLDQSL